MMATEDTQVDGVTVKMEEAVVEQDKDKDESKEVTSMAKVKEERKDSPMEVEKPTKEPQAPKEDISMETESVLPVSTEADEMSPVKEEDRACSSSNKSIGNLELTKEEGEPEEEVAEEKIAKEEEKDSPSEEKMESIPSASPDAPKEVSTLDVTQKPYEHWDIPGTDDEKEELADRKTTGVWMPNAKVIIDLYQKLDKEGILDLQWKCPGRRTPPKEVDEEKKVEENPEEEDVKTEIEEEKQEEEPTEFDFDVETPSITSMAPRRTPGSGQALGSGKKRVARMDKIFNDMLRHKRIDEELARVGDESDDPGNHTDTTPQRHVGKFRIRKDF